MAPTLNGPDAQYTHVNARHQAHVYSIDHSMEHDANQVDQEAYQVPFATDPTTAGDCFFYMKNNSDTDIVIEGCSFMVSAAEEIYIEVGNTGTAVLTTGSALTPANCNSGGGAADCTVWSNVSDGGSDITGLDTGNEIERLWFFAAANKEYFNFEMDVIIKKNDVFSMWAVGGDVVIRGTLVFFFHDAE